MGNLYDDYRSGKSRHWFFDLVCDLSYIKAGIAAEDDWGSDGDEFLDDFDSYVYRIEIKGHWRVDSGIGIWYLLYEFV